MCIVICTLLLSRPARGAWVEIGTDVLPLHHPAMSRPARGAWVEILILIDEIGVLHVAPRKGRVG